MVHLHLQPGVHGLRRVQHRYHSCGIGLRVPHEGRPQPVKYKGKSFKTAEALFQALRIEDEAIREEIRGKATPTVKEGGVQDAYDLVAALYVLDRWKKPEDTALLRKYLKHPDDRIGEHVKVMLEKRDAERPPSSER